MNQFIKINIVLVIVSALITQNFALAQKNDNDIVIGNSIKIYSKVLNEERPLLIYTPYGYEQIQIQYPVLYILDGNQHFFHVTGIVHFLSDNGFIPQMIVVGLPNVNRTRDFSPTRVQGRPETGGANNFLKFMEKELIPFVDQNYRTTQFKILSGHCMTGLFTIYTLLTKPAIFDAYIASSPYVIWDDEFITNYVETVPVDLLDTNKFLFMSVGREDRPDLIPLIPKFKKVLEKKALKDLDWKFITIENEEHGTIIHKTLYEGLRELYSDLMIPDNLTNGNIEVVKQKINTLAKSFGYKDFLPEITINNVGYRLLTQRKFEEAITIFKINVEAYPASANAYDSLGEAYMENGDKQQAIKNYQKSLELNPDNTNAVEMLKRIREN